MSAALELKDLRTVLDAPDGQVRAVDGVDLAIEKGECFALVGESGCGKSMTALSILRLLPDVGRITGGSVRLGEVDLLALPEAAMRAVRGKRAAMIFQEPATALNPVLTVGRQVTEVIERHTDLRGAAARRRTLELLQAVGIPEAERRMGEYAFQLSGGLRQRVMIAGALAVDPEVLIADEPTTALDVTIQAQILELLKQLQTTRGMALLLITHDLGIVAKMADRVAVMYAGRIVEQAPVGALFSDPKHPYTRGLLDSVPGGAPGTRLRAIEGSVPPLGALPAGCAFVTRCPRAFEPCPRVPPGDTVFTPPDALGDGDPYRTVKCYLHGPAVEPAGVAR
jgi:peptide/nickel transport system ATP-binding protein